MSGVADRVGEAVTGWTVAMGWAATSDGARRPPGERWAPECDGPGGHQDPVGNQGRAGKLRPGDGLPEEEVRGGDPGHGDQGAEGVDLGRIEVGHAVCPEQLRRGRAGQSQEERRAEVARVGAWPPVRHHLDDDADLERQSGEADAAEPLPEEDDAEEGRDDRHAALDHEEVGAGVHLLQAEVLERERPGDAAASGEGDRAGARATAT